MITAGQETITVLGRKLITLRDVLNSGRLLEVTVMEKSTASGCITENGITVSEIRFAVVE